MRGPGPGACPPTENRVDGAEETCADTPECAVVARSAAQTESAGSEDAVPAARRGPERCPDYLAWIRTLPCIVCSRLSGGDTVVEAAHTNALGPRGMGQKTSDFSAIPLCSWHHRAGRDSYHRLGEKWFAQAYQIHLLEVVQTLNRRKGRQIPWLIVSIS